MATANTSNIELVHRHFSSEKCVDPLNQGWGTCGLREHFIWLANGSSTISKYLDSKSKGVTLLQLDKGRLLR